MTLDEGTYSNCRHLQAQDGRTAHRVRAPADDLRSRCGMPRDMRRARTLRTLDRRTAARLQAAG